jgi:hypothetical protein
MACLTRSPTCRRSRITDSRWPSGRPMSSSRRPEFASAARGGSCNTLAKADATGALHYLFVARRFGRGGAPGAYSCGRPMVTPSPTPTVALELYRRSLAGRVVEMQPGLHIDLGFDRSDDRDSGQRCSDCRHGESCLHHGLVIMGSFLLHL